MARVVEGLETDGLQVDFLKAFKNDLDGDGKAEYIQQLSCLGSNGKQHIVELVGIDMGNPAENKNHLHARYDILKKMKNEKFGAFDYVALTGGVTANSKKAAKKIRFIERRYYRQLNAVAKQSQVYLSASNSTRFEGKTYRPAMHCSTYKKSLHIINDPDQFLAEYDIEAPGVNNAKRVTNSNGQIGYDTDGDGDFEILDSNPLLEGNCDDCRGNSFGGPFALGKAIAHKLTERL